MLVDELWREQAAKDLQVGAVDDGEGGEHLEGGVPEAHASNAKGQATPVGNALECLLNLWLPASARQEADVVPEQHEEGAAVGNGPLSEVVPDVAELGPEGRSERAGAAQWRNGADRELQAVYSQGVQGDGNRYYYPDPELT